MPRHAHSLAWRAGVLAIAAFGLLGTFAISQISDTASNARLSTTRLAAEAGAGLGRPLIPGVGPGAASINDPAFAEEYVNLANPARTNHILNGDATGGGHLWPGLEGKTPFPADWSGAKIMNMISDVATDPEAAFEEQGATSIATGTREGVDIRVIIRNGEIWSGYPTNLMPNW